MHFKQYINKAILLPTVEIYLILKINFIQKKLKLQYYEHMHDT